MNVQLKQEFQIPGAVYTDDQLMINNYYVTVEMVTVDTKLDDLDIATKRIEWFVYNELADAVFVDQADTDRNTILAMLGLNVVTLPGPPVDQLVGIMLSCKLNAIVEGRLEVVETTVSSDHSKGLWFRHSNAQTVGPFEQSGWWHEPTVDHNNIVIEDEENNVVKVSVNPWLEYDLAWSSNTTGKTEAKIIVGNFNKKHDV
jgi:hypothetical protein